MSGDRSVEETSSPALPAGRGPGGGVVAGASRFELDPKRYPTLAQIGRNLTAMAARGELDPVVGRDEEIERTLDVLAKRHANNPCLVGVGGRGEDERRAWDRGADRGG